MNEHIVFNKLRQFAQESEWKDIQFIHRQMANAFILWDFWMSFKFVLIVFAVVIIVPLLFWIVLVMLSSNWRLYFTFVKSCELPPVAAYFISVQSAIYLAVLAGLIVFAFKRSDAFSFLKQDRSIAAILLVNWTFFIILYAIVAALRTYYIKVEAYWPSIYFLLLPSEVDIFLSIWLPCLSSCIFPNQKVSDTAMIGVVDNNQQLLKVKRKLLSAIQNSSTFKNAEFLDEYIRILGNEQLLAVNYMNRNFMKTFEWHQTIRERVDQRMVETQHDDCTDNGIELEETAMNKKDEININEQMEITHHLLNMKEYSANVRDVVNMLSIKLAFIPLEYSSGEKICLTEMISPFASIGDQFAVNCKVRSALLVGPWLLEFNEAGLCIPKRCLVNKPVFIIPVTTVETETNVFEVISKICQFVAHVNVNVEYAPCGSLAGSKMNSQQFVDALLKKLRFDPRIGKHDAYAKLIGLLRTMDNRMLSLYPSDKFMQRFNLPNAECSFSTHADLDQFIEQIHGVDPLVHVNHSTEYEILSQIDKAMWRKYNFIKQRLHPYEKKKTELSFYYDLAIVNNEPEEEYVQSMAIQELECSMRNVTVVLEAYTRREQCVFDEIHSTTCNTSIYEYN